MAMDVGEVFVVAVAVAVVDMVVVVAEARITKQRIIPKRSGRSYHMKRWIKFEKSVTERVNKEEPNVILRRCPQNN